MMLDSNNTQAYIRYIFPTENLSIEFLQNMIALMFKKGKALPEKGTGSTHSDNQQKTQHFQT